MAKLTRTTGKVFGATADPTDDPTLGPEIGQFGSALAGTYNGTTDVATIQALPAWSNGFIDAVTPSNQYPPLPEMTGFGKVLSHQNCYLLQQGMPEWDSATTYYENGFCAYGDLIYRSLIDENLNNKPDENPSAWAIYGSVEDDYANKDLQNLTVLGNSRLQFAPFAINQGTVSNGENNTLTASLLYKKYNFNETGTLTKSVGAVSGFSLSNYGTLPKRFYSAVSGGKSWEVVVAFETTDKTVGQMLFTDGVGSGQVGYRGFTIEITTAGKLQVDLDWSTASGVGGVLGNVDISNNTKYWVKVTFNGTQYSAYLSTDGFTYTNFFNYNSSTPLASSGDATYLGIAKRGSFVYPATNSTIYLNDSYVKINGEVWWNGVYDSNSGDYDYTIGNSNTINCDPCTITTADGRTLVDGIGATLDTSTTADGNYFVLKDFSDGSLSLIDNLYIGKTNSKPWTQPVLTANGTLGGSSFAVAASAERNSHYAWYAVDGVTTGATGWFSQEISGAGVWYEFYNPIPLNVTNLSFLNYNAANYVTTSGKVQISDDGATWTDIKSYTNSTLAANALWSIDLSDNTAFSKYYRIYSDSNYGTAGWIIREMTITATEEVNNWLDISTVPANLKLYNDGVYEINNDKVCIGECTVSSGIVTALRNYQFNMNGFWELSNLPDYDNKISITSGVAYTAELNGWILNGNAVVQPLYKGNSYTPSASGYYFARMRGY